MKFVIDHDVPHEVASVLQRQGHEVVLLRAVLPITSTDEQIFIYARDRSFLLVTCNRNHQDVASHLLPLIHKAGDAGLSGNINFA